MFYFLTWAEYHTALVENGLAFTYFYLSHFLPSSSKSKGSGRSASIERSGGSSGIGSGSLGIFSMSGNSSNSNPSADRLHLAAWASGGPGHHHNPASIMPSQPFAQDPSMPLLTPPNPTTQLEEAKRRLETQQQHHHPSPAGGQTGMSTSLSGVTSSQARGAVLGGYSASSGAAAPVKSK